jgi:4-amino-4-deoxy-L-arabinose transferase-like glycosyltransferase
VKASHSIEETASVVGRPLKMSRIEPWLYGWRPYALLGALCLLLYLPGLTAIPALDRDEARFAQATRQMLETGDFLNIRFQDEARNRKPAGIYWLQAASVAVFSTPESTAIWPYRLPSLIGATLAVLLTFGLGRPLLRSFPDPAAAPLTALIAAVFLASALGVVAEAHIAKTDAALLACVVAGQGALGLAYVRARAGATVGLGVSMLFWVAEAAAILLKGPVAIAVAIVTAATLSIADRDARWLRALRPVLGVVFLVVAVAPWLVAIQSATEGRFLSDSLGRDFLGKLLDAQESHGAPPFYYLVLVLFTFWPGSLFLAPGLIRGWRLHDLPVVRFLLAWLVPAWVFIELVPTKLPHYVLPLYPALALLAASALVDGSPERPAWSRFTILAMAALWVVATLLIGAALIVLPIRFGDGVSIASLVAGVVLVGLMVASLWLRPPPIVAAGFVAALAAVLVLPATMVVVPGLDRLWLSREAAALVADNPPAPGTPLIVVGYNEPSLVFLLGTKLRSVIAGSAASALGAGGEALVGGREDAMFRQGLAARGLGARVLGEVRGTDYSNGQRMVLTLYKVGSD